MILFVFYRNRQRYVSPHSLYSTDMVSIVLVQVPNADCLDLEAAAWRRKKYAYGYTTARTRKLQQAGRGDNGPRSSCGTTVNGVNTCGLLRVAFVRFMNSPKQTLNKKALRISRQMFSPNINTHEIRRPHCGLSVVLTINKG